MSILYCLIANKHCALAEFSKNGDKQMSKVAHKLQSKLDFEQSSTESVDYESKTYSYRVSKGIVYICVTDESFGRSSAALFLKYICQLFDDEFGTRGQATKLELDMNRDFAKTLEDKMTMFSSSSGQAKLRELQKDLNKVKEKMQYNIQKSLDRGDKIELLVDKTDELSSQSTAFSQSSKALRRHMWIQSMKMKILITTLVFIFLAMLFVYVRSKAS